MKNQLVFPPILDRIVDERKSGSTISEIARKLNLKTTTVCGAIKYAESMGRLSGKEVREARIVQKAHSTE